MKESYFVDMTTIEILDEEGTFAFTEDGAFMVQKAIDGNGLMCKKHNCGVHVVRQSGNSGACIVCNDDFSHEPFKMRIGKTGGIYITES